MRVCREDGPGARDREREEIAIWAKRERDGMTVR